MKTSRFLTHLKKLEEPGPPIALYFSHSSSLRERLGPVFYQLPPRSATNLERLEDLPTNPSPGIISMWIEYHDQSSDLRRERSSSSIDLQRRFASTEHGEMGYSHRLVGPFISSRLHGPQHLCRELFRPDPGGPGRSGTHISITRGCRCTCGSTTTLAVIRRRTRSSFRISAKQYQRHASSQTALSVHGLMAELRYEPCNSSSQSQTGEEVVDGRCS